MEVPVCMAHFWKVNLALVRFVCVLAAQSCPTLCNPMDCSLPGSSVHGILQASILEWVAISFSKGSSWSWDGTQVSSAGRCFTLRATREGFCTLKSWFQFQKYFTQTRGVTELQRLWLIISWQLPVATLKNTTFICLNDLSLVLFRDLSAMFYP